MRKKISSEFLRSIHTGKGHRGIEQMSQQTFPPGSKVIIDDFDQSYNRTVATVKKYSRSKKLYTVTAHDKVILKVKQTSIFYAGDRPPKPVNEHTDPPESQPQTEPNDVDEQTDPPATVEQKEDGTQDVQNFGGLCGLEQAKQCKIKHCSACCKPHNPPTLTLTSCSGCRKAYYCSVECQKTHWTGGTNKHGGHKLACKILKKHFPTFKSEERLGADKCIICNGVMPYFQKLETRVLCCGQRGHDACFREYDGFVSDEQNRFRHLEVVLNKCPGCGHQDDPQQMKTLFAQGLPSIQQSYITKCAEEKIPWAMSTMADRLSSTGQPEARRQARQLLEEVAAQSGDAAYLTQLGHDLATQYPKDFERSEKLYIEAISKGWPEAYARFGELVMFGESSITSMQGKFELAHALYLAYLRHSFQANSHSRAGTNIGLLFYHSDIGVGSINDSFNYDMAKKYFELGITRGEPRAAHCLAVLDGSQPSGVYA